MSNSQEVKAQISSAPVMLPLQEMIEKSSKELSRALPVHMRPERLVRIALTCIRQNPKLAECTSESFVGALLTSAQLGIEPVMGRGYLLPFNNKRKIGNDWKVFKEVTFLLGYRGIAELFYRHEKGTVLNWGVVKEKDDFEYEYGTNAYLKHRPKNGERGNTVGYWVMATLQNKEKSFMVMSKAECIEHGKKHSKTWVTEEYINGSKVKCEPHFLKDSPWVTDEDSMCLKTDLIQLSKLLPLSFEVQQALQSDETSRDYKEGVRDAMEMPITTQWEKEDAQEAEVAPANVPTIEAPTKESWDFITEVERKALLGLMSGKGKNKAYLDELLASKYGITSTTKIPKFMLEEIRIHFNKYPDVPVV